jgi:hypothetical protein
MVFVRLGRLLAWALTILGSMRIAGALFDAVASLASYQPATRRYIGLTGEIIEQGLMYVAAGIVVGLLVHIADRTED